MTDGGDNEITELALEWVREAGALTLEHFRDPELTVDSKGDGTPVTVADRRTEELLRTRIRSVFPDDAILGEEGGSTEGTTGRTWIIDPIDGTKAFSHGVATYSNLLAVADQHGTRIGIINLPALGETLWAVRGEGCWFNGRRIGRAENDQKADLNGRVLCVSGFHDWDGAMHDRVADAGVLVRTWGDAYGYALVASGRADAMFDPQLEWWDLAAPALVVAEAGGTITRRDGSPEVTVPGHDRPYGLSAVASTGGDHRLWVELLA